MMCSSTNTSTVRPNSTTKAWTRRRSVYPIMCGRASVPPAVRLSLGEVPLLGADEPVGVRDKAVRGSTGQSRVFPGSAARNRAARAGPGPDRRRGPPGRARRALVVATMSLSVVGSESWRRCRERRSRRSPPRSDSGPARRPSRYRTGRAASCRPPRSRAAEDGRGDRGRRHLLEGDLDAHLPRPPTAGPPSSRRCRQAARVHEGEVEPLPGQIALPAVPAPVPGLAQVVTPSATTFQPWSASRLSPPRR